MSAFSERGSVLAIAGRAGQFQAQATPTGHSSAVADPQQPDTAIPPHR
jgi:hypothetical protein